MFWVPLLAGVGLGGATVALMVLGGVLNQRGTWATTMVAIGSFYVVFAIQSGDTLEIIVHTGLAAGFAGLAIIGARTSSWILAAALLAHGFFHLDRRCHVAEAIAELLDGVHLHEAALVAGARIRRTSDESLAWHFAL